MDKRGLGLTVKSNVTVTEGIIPADLTGPFHV